MRLLLYLPIPAAFYLFTDAPLLFCVIIFALCPVIDMLVETLRGG